MKCHFITDSVYKYYFYSTAKTNFVNATTLRNTTTLPREFSPPGHLRPLRGTSPAVHSIIRRPHRSHSAAHRRQAGHRRHGLPAQRRRHEVPAAAARRRHVQPAGRAHGVPALEQVARRVEPGAVVVPIVRILFTLNRKLHSVQISKNKN